MRRRSGISRKSSNAKRCAKIRAQETPEQRAKRLTSNRLRQAARRAAETIEQRESRLLADRMRIASKRASERYSAQKEMREKRLEADRVRIAARRASETIEEREIRLLAERERQAARRAAETIEERNRRLLTNRIRIKAVRQALKNSYHPENLNKKTENVKYQMHQNYQKLSNMKNFFIYSESIMPAPNYSGSAFHYSMFTPSISPCTLQPISKPSASIKQRNANVATVSENALKHSALILMNTDGSCYTEEHRMPVIQQVFYNCDNNQQNVNSDVESVNSYFPICEIEESTEIITPD